MIARIKQVKRGMFELVGLSSHPWEGTQHCLRQTEEAGKDGGCCNDHTGCLWNNGHNGCNFENATRTGFDSPLYRRKN